MYVCIYIYTYIYTYIYICMYVCMYTYTHICICLCITQVEHSQDLYSVLAEGIKVLCASMCVSCVCVSRVIGFRV